MFADRHHGRYLHRTSLLLREQVRQAVPSNRDAIDRHVRVVSRWRRPAARERQRNRTASHVLGLTQCQSTRRPCGMSSRMFPWDLRLVCRLVRVRVPTVGAQGADT